MSTDTNTGIVPFRDGSAYTWSRQELTEDEARVLRAQAEGCTYRLTTIRDHPDGSATLAQYEVPEHWLHGFVYAIEDSPGESEVLLSAEAVGP